MNAYLFLIVALHYFVMFATCSFNCNITTNLSNYTFSNQHLDYYNLYNNDHLSPLESYPDNMTNCWHIVKLNSNYGLKVLFNKFDLQDAECGLNKNECCDYLEIGFGSIVGENKIKKLCGRNQFYEPMFLESNEVWFNFITDANTSFIGFYASFEPFQLVYNNLIDTIKCPDYDNSINIYPNKVDVTFKIDLPDKYLIVLTFNSINLEKFNDTCYDYLEIIEPSSERQELTSLKVLDNSKKRSQTIICGNDEPKDYISSTNKLKLRFFSDETLNGNLFEIQYKTIQSIGYY